MGNRKKKKNKIYICIFHGNEKGKSLKQKSSRNSYRNAIIHFVPMGVNLHPDSQPILFWTFKARCECTFKAR